jgi:hypothetical protein
MHPRLSSMFNPLPDVEHRAAVPQPRRFRALTIAVAAILGLALAQYSKVDEGVFLSNCHCHFGKTVLSSIQEM